MSDTLEQSIMQERFAEHTQCQVWRGKSVSENTLGHAVQPLCGDRIWVSATVTLGVIRQIRYHGEGCIVSQACASMLCECVEGRSVGDVLRNSPQDLMSFDLSFFSEWKRRCALLAWEGLSNALLSSPPFSTEVLGVEVEEKPPDLVLPGTWRS